MELTDSLFDGAENTGVCKPFLGETSVRAVMLDTSLGVGVCVKRCIGTSGTFWFPLSLE